MEKMMSLATKRAIERGYFEKDGSWYTHFAYTDITGDLGYEEGVVRRDPSSVLLVDGTYYVWYTKSVGESYGFNNDKPDEKKEKWDLSDIWYATSKDGYEWKEMGVAAARGPEGTYDARSIFTPEILEHEGEFYLTYQCMTHPFLNRVKNTIGMSVANSPDGPFVRLEEPILKTSDSGEWEGDDDNKFRVKVKGEFDSYQVHDPSLHYFKGKFYLYYKGEPMGEELYVGGRETKWGVAIADKSEGPYVKSPYNPVTNSGHETCLWEYDGGLVGMVTSDGMERNTFQYAKDGVNFEIMGTCSRFDKPPHAAGPFRIKPEDSKQPLDGIRWGLAIANHPKWDYIIRFDINERLKNHIMSQGEVN